VGRMFSSASAYLRVPDALSEGGEGALREVLSRAGLGDVRVTATTAFHTVLQARVRQEQP
jgi:hypothetical protein